MKNRFKKGLSAFAAVCGTVAMLLTPVPVSAANSGGEQKMYRLYNPNSGEHFYTASSDEQKILVSFGWKDEGVGWTAPVKSGTPVYRLYNPNVGDHHYTLSTEERDNLVSVGWNYEGIGWYSDDSKTVPLYRNYNPNAVAGAHNYTTSASERDTLIAAGWTDEGISWYATRANVGDDSSDDTSSQSCAIVNHPAVTHTVTVVDQAAYDEQVLVQAAYDEQVQDGTVVICNGCGQQFNTVDEWIYHSVVIEEAGDDNHNDYHTTPYYITVHHDAVYKTVHHDAVTHQETVVDRAAYSETVCS